MKKMAIFVEGQSEAIFVQRFLEELAGQDNISFQVTRYGRSLIAMQELDPEPKYFALIYDCGTDETVKSSLLEALPTLESTGYSVILGLRDLYPRSRDELPNLESFANLTNSTLPEMIVAIMEIEAWFLAEHCHFQTYHPALTHAHILNELHIDLPTLDFETLPHPSAVLRRIYRLVDAKKYKKKKAQVQRIAHCMDFVHFTTDVRMRSAQIDRFISRLENFLT